MLFIRINSEIEASKIKIVGYNNNSIYTLKEALNIAEENDLDIVEFGTENDCSICKLINYEKYLYEQKKKKKFQKISQVKEIKLHYKIADGDILTKANNVYRILKEGDKVKVSIVFKGREMQFIKLAPELMNKFFNSLKDKCAYKIIVPEKMIGNTYSVVIDI